MPPQYDLAIIGAGSAGLTAARFANRLGKRVALIEANRVGGDCTWTGCIPSKALLQAARVALTIRTAGRYGVIAGRPAVDFPGVMARIRSVVAQIYALESPDALRAQGIDVIESRAEFQDAHTVVAGPRRITAQSFLICTGASPLVPPVPGLAHTPYLTYETFWQLTALPARLIIIGGGPIGCELAQACQRLGSRVTLVEARDRLLPNDEPEASAIVANSLRDDGVDLQLSAPVESVSRPDNGGIIVTAAGRDIAGDAVLVAVGRRPNVAGLGLDAAGVAGDAGGITVNDFLRTGVRNIYAAGDCAGGYQFTHYAGYQGAMAVRNALLPGRARARPRHIPWATFTDPEVARAGCTEPEARQRFGDKVRVSAWPMSQIDRALTDGAADGFIKVVHRPDGTVLGATVTGQRAAEVIQEWAIAVDRRMKFGDLAKTLHAYPSLATGSQQLAWEAYLTGSTGGFRGRLLRWLSR